MVRTAAGIRISAGRSSKKVGKAAAVSTSTGSSNKSKAGSSSTKLPPIPFQETPSWQKPITNFFKSNSPLKAKENTSEGNEATDNVIKGLANDPEPARKKLKFDREENNSEHDEENNKVQDSKEKNESENCEETSTANKENSTKSKSEFDEGASSSKD